MGKNKPRHDPEKKQNKYGKECYFYDNTTGSGYRCDFGNDVSICKGNRHNCVKQKYHDLARLSDRQKIEIHKGG